MSESDAQNTLTVSPRRRYAARTLLAALLIVIIFLLLGPIRFFKVPSASMEPTLYPSDYIVAKHVDSYARGDIVVFRDPDYSNEFLVKRIVALGGDTVSVYGGAVFLGGSYVSEPYRHRPIDYIMAPYTVPEDHFFLLGDNANRSIDSHNWGASGSHDAEGVKGSPRSIPHDLIIGKVTRIYLPRSRSGTLNSYPIRPILTR